MHTQIKTSFLFFTFTLFLCLNSFFLRHTVAQDNTEPVAAPASAKYTFESIDVPGVDFLELTASSDFGDYAGNTKSEDGTKTVGFTLIDGVFTRHDFPGSKNTYFYALGNDGTAAGHYEDSDGLFHGVVLENGEWREYNFPDSVETEIYGISDATGALTGNFTDAEGIRRGFTGDEIIEFPGASETFADFVAAGRLVGSYVDANGIFQAYVRSPDGRYTSFKLADAAGLEYFFIPGINDAGTYIFRFKAKGLETVPRTQVRTFGEKHELLFPGSVSTQGYNINQDGSIVGNYVSADGRTLGFVASPTVGPAEEAVVPTGFNYTFESIDVPGVDFLELTASSDFEDYAGNTESADGTKTIGFTLIDGVFTTYDFPGSKNTYFYALGNNGQAAGHYEDSNGLYHGVILENGELQPYHFPGAVQTFIYGLNDETGVLTGSYIDAAGVRRGFSGDETVEYPEAKETDAYFVAEDRIVGSYVGADGVPRAYLRHSDGKFSSIDIGAGEVLEHFFVPGINDAGIAIIQTKRVDGVRRTFVNTLRELYELKFPGSISIQGWNINQDGSIVGNYDSADGRRHGFIARPVSQVEAESYSNAYNVTLAKGLNMFSVPLAPATPMNAKALVAIIGATTVITLDAVNQRFVAWTPSAPDDGFPIEGGKGYIVNVPETRNFAFVGSRWTNQTEAAAAPPAIPTEPPQEAWAFVVSGHLEGKPAFDGYQVSVRNLRTNSTITASVQGDYFAAATADLTRWSVVQVGDVVEVRVIGPNGNFESQTLSVKVTPEDLANAVLSVRLDDIGKPTQNLLLQNYPNPFNPETWIPYQLAEPTEVSVSIYAASGQLVRTLALGHQPAGVYQSRSRAAYWDGKNDVGEAVSSGVYFYTLEAGKFFATRKMLILK